LKTKQILGLSALALSLAGGVLMVGNHFYNMSIRPAKKNKSDTRPVPIVDGPARNRLIEGRRWLLEQSGCSQVTLPARDKLMLHAYYHEQPSHLWAVCVHGYGDTASGMGYWAEHYTQLGWNFLLPDLRGHGDSEGAYMGMGWPDRLDILTWLEWLLRRDPDAQIILHGVSMGASTVLMTTGEPLPQNVKAAVSDCAFSCVEDQFRHIGQTKMTLPLPLCLIMFPLRTVTRLRAGYDLKCASAINQVRRSVTPTLFIHGSDDPFVPAQMLDCLYAAAACPKSRLLVAGAGHAAAAPTDPELYWNTVDSFLTPYLNGGTHL